MDSSSARIIASSAAPQNITDAEGRTLHVRRMTALDRLRLYKAAGPELAENNAWMGMALVACSVVQIDQVPIPMPTTEQQIESLVMRLGDAGIAAAMQVFNREPGQTQVELTAHAGN